MSVRTVVGHTSAASVHSARGLRLIAWLLAAYTFVFGLTIRLSGAAQLTYAVLFVVTLLVAANGSLRHGGLGRRIPVALIAWTVLMVVQLLQAPGRLPGPWLDVATDLAVTLTPIVFYLALVTHRATPRDVSVVVLGVVVAGSAAALAAWSNAEPGVRFQAPQILAITGAWALACLPLSRQMGGRVRTAVKCMAWLLVPALLVTSVASRSRTALIVWLLSGALALALPGLRRGHRGVIVLVVALAGGAAWVSVSDQVMSSGTLPSVLEQTRLEEMSGGSLAASDAARIAEVRDVSRTMRSEGGIANFLVGFGHGSSYSPDSSYLANNVNRATGRVHNVHVTPVAVWFRYGFAGLAVLVVLLLGVFTRVIRMFRRERSWLSAVLLMSVSMYLLDCWVRNSLVDPAFSFLIAAVLALDVRRAEEG